MTTLAEMRQGLSLGFNRFFPKIIVYPTGFSYEEARLAAWMSLKRLSEENNGTRNSKGIIMIKKKKSGKGKNLRQAKHKLKALKNRVGGARQRTLKRQEKRIIRLQIDLDKRKK